MNSTARILLAGVLIGVAVGAVFGWASSPAAPEIADRMWLANIGEDSPFQRLIAQYRDTLWQLILRGALVGAVGGAAVAGGVLLLVQIPRGDA